MNMDWLLLGIDVSPEVAVGPASLTQVLVKLPEEVLVELVQVAALVHLVVLVPLLAVALVVGKQVLQPMKVRMVPEARVFEKILVTAALVHGHVCGAA